MHFSSFHLSPERNLICNSRAAAHGAADFMIHHVCSLLVYDQKIHQSNSCFNNGLAWTIKQTGLAAALHTESM